MKTLRTTSLVARWLRWQKPSSVPCRLRFTGGCSQAEFQARCQEQPYWYHAFHFDNGFGQSGEFDIGRDVAGYGFPSDMTGLSVLDVGTGSGWFAAYFEQLGASVTTVDIRGECDLDLFGRPGYGDLQAEKPAPDRVQPDGRAVYHSFASGGFWIMKELLGLKAEFVNARVYDLSPALFGGRLFDLVFVGCLLMHVRDPIGALSAVHSVCRHRVIANSARLERLDRDPEPLMALIAPITHPVCWWKPNRACLEQWFRGAGFSQVMIERTVNLTVDRPGVDALGRPTALNQKLYLVDAYV